MRNIRIISLNKCIDICLENTNLIAKNSVKLAQELLHINPNRYQSIYKKIYKHHESIYLKNIPQSILINDLVKIVIEYIL